MTRVQFGWLIRSIHSWSANLMIFTAFAHMFSVLFLKAYRKPRELTWVTGMLLLFLVMGFGFSGYLLPWNTLAFFATKVGTEIAGQVPVIGRPMMIFLRGGEEVTGATLTRFFGFHVAVLPGIDTLLIARSPASCAAARHECSAESGSRMEGQSSRKQGDEVLPEFRASRTYGLVCRLWRAGCSGRILPVGTRVSRPIRLSRRPPGIKPEWYFLFMFQTLKLIPSKVWFIDGEVLGVLGVRLPVCSGLCCRSLRRTRPSRARPLSGSPELAVFALAYVVGMTIYGFLQSNGRPFSRVAPLAGVACSGRGVPWQPDGNSCLDCHSALTRATRSHAGKVQPGYPRTEGSHLRQLPWRRPTSDDPDAGHEPQGRVERQNRPQADSRAMRHLPFRSNLMRSTIRVCAPIN